VLRCGAAAQEGSRFGEVQDTAGRMAFWVLHGWMASVEKSELMARTSPRIVGWELRSGGKMPEACHSQILSTEAIHHAAPSKLCCGVLHLTVMGFAGSCGKGNGI
jgi:hypothetical protein